MHTHESGRLTDTERLHAQFIAASKKPPVYCIITEYMSQGTLRMYLNKKDPYSLSPETILKLALDISRGMEYLHAQGVIHRDLKSQNLLLNDEMRVKVADFGTSCLETRCQASKGNKGTYRWMAPEMTKEKPYTRKVDVYSFGIVLWELTTCLLPFQGMTPVQAAYAASEKVRSLLFLRSLFQLLLHSQCKKKKKNSVWDLNRSSGDHCLRVAPSLILFSCSCCRTCARRCRARAPRC
jgi:serine/threonine protein kinase